MRIALLFAVLCFGLIGAEVAPVAAGDTALPTWLVYILSFDFVWKGLVTLGGLLISWLFGMLIKRVQNDIVVKDAVDVLKSAVQATYDEFVQEAKKASADGKLSLEEKEKARSMAISKAMALAKGPVLKLLLAWGKPFLEGLVGQIVQKMKAGK